MKKETVEYSAGRKLSDAEYKHLISGGSLKELNKKKQENIAKKMGLRMKYAKEKKGGYKTFLGK